MSSHQVDIDGDVSTSSEEVNNQQKYIDYCDYGIEVDNKWGTPESLPDDDADSNIIKVLDSEPELKFLGCCLKLIDSMNVSSDDRDTVEVTVDDFLSIAEFPECRDSMGELHDSLIEEPDKTIATLIKAAQCLGYEEAVLVGQAPTHTRIEDLRASDIGTLVSIEGRLTDRTDQYPLVRTAHYDCGTCGKSKDIDQSLNGGEELETPTEMSHNEHKSSWVYSMADSLIVDAQQAIVQDLHAYTDTPNPMDSRVDFFEGMVNEIESGETVLLTGIVRAVEDGDKASEHYIQAVGVQHLDESYSGVELTDEDIAEIESMADSPHIHSRLQSSIAPSLVGGEQYDLARRASLLQLAGGVDHSTEGDKHRSDIHVAFVGDPSTGKSSIAKFVHKVAPKSVYQSADNVTKVGLTASVTREERFDGSEWTLSGGPLVQADGGVAVIDELDKGSKKIQNSLQEPLSEQTVSVSKANITNVTLPARCSVLLVANPRGERFNVYDDLPQQIGIEPAIWSRMDVIVPFVDEPNETSDMSVADSILSKATGAESDVVSPKMMRKYIAHARTVEPELSEEAGAFIKSEWAALRQRSAAGTVAIDTRQLDALIRLAEASARIRLDTEVTIEDAERAVDIITDWFDMLAADENGNWNMDRFQTGNTTEREQTSLMWETLTSLQKEGESESVERDDLVSELVELGMEKNEVQQLINKYIGKEDIKQTDGVLRDER